MLRHHGVRVTPQRLAVLRVVSRHPHIAADAVVDEVRAAIGSISRQAVYDALGLLAGRGILRRIQPAGSSARYEDRVGDNHHHLVCRRCGRLVDVDCAVGEAPCLTATDDWSFEIDEAEVIYWGNCPECLDSTVGPGAPSATSSHTDHNSPESNNPHETTNQASKEQEPSWQRAQ